MNPIRLRTDEERRAWYQGYAAGVRHIAASVAGVMRRANRTLGLQEDVVDKIAKPETMEEYTERLNNEQGVGIHQLRALGFEPMTYPGNLWPPILGADMFVCVPVRGKSRTGRPTNLLVPVLHARRLSMDRDWLRDRVVYHQENAGQPPYGKT